MMIKRRWLRRFFFNDEFENVLREFNPEFEVLAIAM